MFLSAASPEMNFCRTIRLLSENMVHFGRYKVVEWLTNKLDTTGSITATYLVGSLVWPVTAGCAFRVGSRDDHPQPHPDGNRQCARTQTIHAQYTQCSGTALICIEKGTMQLSAEEPKLRGLNCFVVTFLANSLK